MVSMAAINMMEKYGGGFVKALAFAWHKADPYNKARLETAFSYFEEYEQKAKFFYD